MTRKSTIRSLTGRCLIGGIPALLSAFAFSSLVADADPQPVRDRGEVKRQAQEIDTMVEAALREAGLKPAPLADESAFLRRTYLAIVGRIPTEVEIAAYARAGSSDKARDLIDELLESKGYESHAFNWWADLLRARGKLAQRASGEPYIHWLKSSIARNKRYDTMVRELLTASGPVHQRDNGATGYLMRDRNMPEDNMSNTIRLFLGSRVECAQCHNHPFDKWTQKQYFEMVAFTGGIQYARNGRDDPRARELVKQAQAQWGRNGVRALRRTLEPTYIGIYGTGTGMARLPKDYQYEDARPLEWTTAQPLFDPPVHLDVNMPNEAELRARVRGRNKEKKIQRMLRNARPKEADSRTAFADWLTSPANPRFAKVIANRLWQRAFGRGLIEPVDDIKDDTIPVSPELMDHLARLMVDLDFDLREFQRVLFNTRLWRREAIAPADTPGTIADLRGPVLRRMTAEQAWDSMLALVVPDLDGKLQPPLGPRAERVYETYDKLGGATDEEILKQAGLLALRYSDPDKAREMQQAERAKMQAENRAKREQARPLYRQLKLAQRAKDQAKIAEVQAKLRAMGLQPPGSRAGRGVDDLARASDLPSPAPDGHLLRELGQSERELIGEAHVDPTVPQVLALLNAFVEQKLLTNRDAALMRSLRDAKGAKSKVTSAFLAVLGRAPTSGERSMWERELSGGGLEAERDLVWTLVNTHEFLFIQ